MINYFSILALLLISLSVANNNAFSQNTSSPLLSGTIFFDGETYLEFEDLLYVHGAVAPTSRLNKLKSIKIAHKNSIRVISLAIMKYLRIDNFKLEINQYGNEVLRNAQIRIETKSRHSIDMNYYELEWILIKTRSDETGKLEEKKIEFVKNGKLNIKKILLD
jgi:urease gamma subunit